MSTETKRSEGFTPGPWRAGWEGRGLTGPRTAPTCYLDGTGTQQIPIHVNGEAVAWVLSSDKDFRMRADAELIASAPTMRATLDATAGSLAEIEAAIFCVIERGADPETLDALDHILEAVSALLSTVKEA